MNRVRYVVVHRLRCSHGLTRPHLFPNPSSTAKGLVRCLSSLVAHTACCCVCRPSNSQSRQSFQSLGWLIQHFLFHTLPGGAAVPPLSSQRTHAGWLAVRSRHQQLEEMSCRPQRPHFSTTAMRHAHSAMRDNALCEQSTRLSPRQGGRAKNSAFAFRWPGPWCTGFPSGSLILPLGSAVIANHQPAASPAATGRLSHLRQHLRVRDGRSPDRKLRGRRCQFPPLCAPGAARRMDAALSGPVGREGAPPSVGGTSDGCRGQGCRAAAASAQCSSTNPYASSILLPRRWCNRVGARDPWRSGGFIWLLRSVLILVHGAASSSSSPFSKVNK